MALNFSLPTIPSLTSRTPDPKPALFVPDIEKLVKFVEGDIGIADGIQKSLITKNISQIKSPFGLEVFAKASGLVLQKKPAEYFKNGKVEITPDQIEFESSPGDLGGIKPLEKALIQSIYETQKPYIEIIKLVVDNFVIMEDIVARVLAFTGRSGKPSGNPKALGFKGGSASLANSMAKLQKLARRPSGPKKSWEDGDLPIDNKADDKTSEGNNQYVVESIVYSNGFFDPNVQYTYVYKDVPDETINLDDAVPEEPINYEEDLPELVVFGVFDKNWNPVNPKLIETPLSEAQTQGSADGNMNWIVQSGKWFGQFDQIREQVDFTYVKNLLDQIVYWGENEGPVVQAGDETIYPKKDLPKINTDTQLRQYFVDYYLDDAREKLSQRGDLSEETKQIYLEKIQEIISPTGATANSLIQDHIEGLIGLSFLPYLKNKPDLAPDLGINFAKSAFPFKPKKVTHKGKQIWIDPESKYDLKVLQFIPVDSAKAEDLISNRPYSPDFYGTPVSKRQNLTFLPRPKYSEEDDEIYFVIEGFLSSKNNQREQEEGDSGYYNIIDALGTIPIFIGLLIQIFSKTVPEIQKFLELVQNPSKTVSDVIIAKAGDNFGTEPEKFGFFSKEFIDDIKKLAEIQKDEITIGSTASATNAEIERKKKKEKKAKMEKFIKNSKLKKYFYVSPDAIAKFILDGVAVVGLFGDAPVLQKLPGLKFGIETKFGTLASTQPDIPIKFFIEPSTPNNEKTKDELSGDANTDPNARKEVETRAGGRVNLEEVSIDYSTGQYKENVNYNYIYVTQYLGETIQNANQEAQRGNFAKAIEILKEAKKIDPENSTVQEILDGNIEELKKQDSSNSTQPVLSFLLSLVTLPLKVVFGIVSFILDFFLSLGNPFELSKKLIDFVSFKWILDFFSPTSKNSMFAMAGLLFDIETFLLVWLPSIQTGAMQSYDLSKIIKLPWSQPLPTYTLDQIKTMIYGIDNRPPVLLPLLMLNGILQLIQGIINGFIDFIWGLLGLGALIPPPYIDLTKENNADLSQEDIMALLNGNFSGNSTYTFAYTVKTPEGQEIEDLDRVKLDTWMQENKNLQFVFQT